MLLKELVLESLEPIGKFAIQKHTENGGMKEEKLTDEAMKEEAIADIIERLDGYSGYYCDLHNEVFNTDYYIIGTFEAKEALKEYDVFEAIELVQTYEKEQFGEVYTDLSNPEKLINMVYYIIGEEVIGEMYDIEAFNDNWNNVADDETNEKIIEAMKEKYNI